MLTRRAAFSHLKPGVPDLSIFNAEVGNSRLRVGSKMGRRTIQVQQRLQLVKLRKRIARHARRLHLLARLAPFAKPNSTI